MLHFKIVDLINIDVFAWNYNKNDGTESHEETLNNEGESPVTIELDAVSR